MKLTGRNALLLLATVIIMHSCDPEKLPENPNFENLSELGTLRVWFKISHPWLPSEKIIRTGLHVAKDGMEIYKHNYLQSANVYNNQENYFFYLEPGTYYYEASIACTCGGDTCSAAGFPGNQWGGKYTMGKFTVKKGETTTVIPLFQ